MDEGALRKWMGFELGKLSSGLVTQPVRLADLLAMPAPQAPTREGGTHAFDPATLRRLAARLPAHTAALLRLPVTVVEPNDLVDGYVEDAAAIAALQALGLAPTAPRDGRLWMAAVLWRRLARDWPGVFQFLML